MPIALFLAVALFQVGPGLTTPFESVICGGEDLADETRAEWLVNGECRIGNAELGNGDSEFDSSSDYYWDPADSLTISGEFGPGSRLVVTCPTPPESLELYFPLDTLATECRAAVDYAPSWLEEELTSAFRRLGDSAVFYADLLLAAPQQYADEIAFCIASIGPEVLVHPLFSPELLEENARYLYEIADSLQYAEIVDRGSPPGAYHSTVLYSVLSGEDTVQLELPRMIYYQYVVHPTTSDEMPRMDDYVYNKHWREYLFYDADSGYPVLCDYIKHAEIVWDRSRYVFSPGRPFEPTDYALDIIGNWATRTLPSGASGNRPIHPNVIAHEHNGNCGECQDLLTAASRACLIPVVNTMDPCEDHVWCEFWDQTWYPYQIDLGFGVTHVADSSVAYDEQVGGSKRVSAIWNWRPDGYWWTVTGKYSNTCSLYVRALDQRGLPIDGARVLIYSEGWVGGLSTTAIGFTDSDGAVAFELGDLRNFYARVSSPIGDYPSPDTSVKIIDLSQTGAVYYKTFYVPAPLPAPRPVPEQFTGDSTVVCKFEVAMGIASELDYGYCISRGAGSGDPDDTVRFYQYYSDEQSGATVDLFITDTAGYSGYLAGERFGALWLGDNTPSRRFTFVCPTADPHRLVFSSEDKLYLSRWLETTVRLYVRTPGVAEGGATEPVRVSFPTVSRGHLNLNLSRPMTLQIFDVTGRLLEQHDVGPPGHGCETALETGVYLLRLESKDDEAAHLPVRKLIVLR